MRIGGGQVSLALDFVHGARVTVPEYLGASAATTPPSESSNQTGTDLVVPVPTGVGVGVGDRLLALVRSSITGVVADQSGWFKIGVDPHFLLYQRFVDDGDPAEYSWTVGSGASRSAVMIATRGGVLGAVSSIASNMFTVPDVTVVTEQGLVISFFTASNGATASDNTTADAPLVLRAQHSNDGSAAYSVSRDTAVATESPGIGTVSGRTFADPAAANQRTFALVLEVG